MKGAKWLTMTVLAMASAATSRADWSEVRKGLDEKAALAAVGSPMIASRSKSRVHVTWTYDAGGYIQFEQGRVAHWVAPKASGAIAGAPVANLKANAAALDGAPVTTRAARPAAKPASARYVIVR